MPRLLRSPNPAEEQRIPDKAQDPVGRTRTKNRQPVHASIVSPALPSHKLKTCPRFAPLARRVQALSLKTEAAEPLHYKFGKTVTYVTSDGRVIEASRIRKDSKVRVHYLKEGDDMVVDKVIVTRDRD
jgi:hypothetical protein